MKSGALLFPCRPLDNFSCVYSASLPLAGIMPIPLFGEVLFKGISAVPLGWPIVKAAPWFLLLYILKIYFSGASNSSERLMHSKVVMITVRDC